MGYDQSCDIWSIGVITYILLSGFPPFYAADPDPRQNTRMILQQVKTKVIEDSDEFFPDPEWTSISQEGKELVLRMLSRDPSKRPTAEELLLDPWLANNQYTKAIPAVARLRKFNAKRKLRAAYFALKATNRMAALVQSMRATQIAIKFAQTYTLEHVENLYDAFDECAHREFTSNRHHDLISRCTMRVRLFGQNRPIFRPILDFFFTDNLKRLVPLRNR